MLIGVKVSGKGRPVFKKLCSTLYIVQLSLSSIGRAPSMHKQKSDVNFSSRILKILFRSNN